MSEQTRQNAILAQQILDNPIYQQTMMQLKAQMYQTFANSSHDDDVTRTEVWRTQKVLNAIETHFESIIEDGEIAAYNINLENQS